MMSFLGIRSFRSSGQVKVLMARGMALLTWKVVTTQIWCYTNWIIHGDASETSIIDGKIYHQIFCLAKRNGSCRDFGGSVSSDIETKSRVWSQCVFWIIVLQVSIKVPKMRPQSAGPGDTPKVKCKVISRIPLCMVRNSGAVWDTFGRQRQYQIYICIFLWGGILAWCNVTIC